MANLSARERGPLPAGNWLPGVGVVPSSKGISEGMTELCWPIAIQRKDSHLRLRECFNQSLPLHRKKGKEGGSVLKLTNNASAPPET